MTSTSCGRMEGVGGGGSEFAYHYKLMTKKATDTRPVLDGGVATPATPSRFDICAFRKGKRRCHATPRHSLTAKLSEAALLIVNNRPSALDLTLFHRPFCLAFPFFCIHVRVNDVLIRR